MIRAVIDTNVVASAMLSPHGKEALIPLAIRRKLLRPCVSAVVLGEYREVLNRPKFGFAPDAIAQMLATFLDHAEHAVAEGSTAHGAITLPDPDDVAFLERALTLHAEYIVTGNKRHFPSAACGAVQVVNTAELLNRIALEL